MCTVLSTLQNSMAHPARIVVHAVAVSVMTYGYVSLSSLPDDTWVRNQAGGRSQFLTIQGSA